MCVTVYLDFDHVRCTVRKDLVDAARKNRLGHEKTIEDYCGTDEAAKNTYVIAQYDKPPYKGTWWIGEGIST